MFKIQNKRYTKYSLSCHSISGGGGVLQENIDIHKVNLETYDIS